MHWLSLVRMCVTQALRHIMLVALHICLCIVLSGLGMCNTRLPGCCANNFFWYLHVLGFAMSSSMGSGVNKTHARAVTSDAHDVPEKSRNAEPLARFTTLML